MQKTIRILKRTPVEDTTKRSSYSGNPHEKSDKSYKKLSNSNQSSIWSIQSDELAKMHLGFNEKYKKSIQILNNRTKPPSCQKYFALPLVIFPVDQSSIR
jgi:hypothetical protein